MMVEQTVMSRSAFVNFRRFSGGAEDVVVDVPVRRVDRVEDVSLLFGDWGGNGDWSLSLSAGDVFLDWATEFCDVSSLTSNLEALSLVLDVELLLVDESSVSGGWRRWVDDNRFLFLHLRGAFWLQPGQCHFPRGTFKKIKILLLCLALHWRQQKQVYSKADLWIEASK